MLTTKNSGSFLTRLAERILATRIRIIMVVTNALFILLFYVFFFAVRTDVPTEDWIFDIAFWGASLLVIISSLGAVVPLAASTVSPATSRKRLSRLLSQVGIGFVVLLNVYYSTILAWTFISGPDYDPYRSWHYDYTGHIALVWGYQFLAVINIVTLILTGAGREIFRKGKPEAT